jgi:HTH-type transcriptional regulator / antitoxin HipB
MARPDQIAQELATRVRTERRSQGLDQQQLALVAGVGVRSIHRIENAEETVRLDIVTKVLSALGLRLTVERRIVR